MKAMVGWRMLSRCLQRGPTLLSFTLIPQLAVRNGKLYSQPACLVKTLKQRQLSTLQEAVLPNPPVYCPIQKNRQHSGKCIANIATETLIVDNKIFNYFDDFCQNQGMDPDRQIPYGNPNPANDSSIRSVKSDEKYKKFADNEYSTILIYS